MDHDHQLHRPRHARPDLVRPAEHLLEAVEGVEEDPVGHDARLRIDAHVERGDHAEEAGPGPARRPEEVRVLVRACVNQLAAGRDHVDGLHAHAGGAVDAAVPAEAALEQIAADGHPDAVAGREEEVVLGERGHELVAAAAGLHAGGHRVGVDGHAGEPREVEEEPAVAHVAPGPAVTAGAHADAHALVARHADRVHHVVLRRRPGRSRRGSAPASRAFQTLARRAPS